MADTPTPTPAQPAQPGTDFSKDLAKALIALAAGLGGRALSNASGNPLTRDVPPQLSQLLDLSVGRTAYQNPLFQATTQGAYAMLPTFARQGTALTGNLSNAIPAAPANTSGGPGLGAIAGPAGLAALAALLGSGSGASGNLSSIANALKKLFGSKPTMPSPTVQGNKPFPGGALTGPSAYDPNAFMGWATPPEPTPNVTTTTDFSYPFDVLNDPYFLNSQWNGLPNDPSGRTGIGPGMGAYYGGGSAEDNPGWPRP